MVLNTLFLAPKVGEKWMIKIKTKFEKNVRVNLIDNMFSNIHPFGS
jgi:hypothetical protein